MGLSAIEKFNARFQKSEAYKKQQEAKKQEEFHEEIIASPDEDIAVSGDGYFKFHKNSSGDANPHYFLSEELLVPHTQNTDTQRLQMFSNHIAQFVHLKTPEFPRVFTNFENQIGEYSIAYKRAKEDFTIIAKVVKNEFNYDLIIQYKKSKIYDILHFNKAHNITEDYGYSVNDCLVDKEVGDTVNKDEFIYKSDNYDEEGNFSYGVNLKAVFIPYKNMTYEDGVVISKSAAEKLTSYKVEKTMFTINGNDLLLNLYGTDLVYKSFPKIGEHVNSGILVASRRRDKRTSLYDLQTHKLKQVDPSNDEVIYTSGGTVTDINIFSNKTLGELRKLRNEGKLDIFNSELLVLYEDQQRYWHELATELEKIIPCKQLSEAEIKQERSEFGHVAKHPIPRELNENKYTNELSYFWKLAHENIDERIQWRDDGKVFDNFKVEFTILKEDPLTEGCKITNRYGGKGVVSMIVDDDKLPITEDGTRADIVLNPLGIVNRLNPSTLIEQYLNFMADHVMKLIRQAEDPSEKIDLYLEFLKMINKKEYDFFDIELMMMNRSQKEEFAQELEREGIYIHQPPFFGNTGEEQFMKIFKEHPEWCTEYKFEGIEKPMTMGDIYFIRLKHQASNKSSMRSAGNLNVKNLPAKSALKKEKKIQYANTPIRLGEMEVTNLMIAKDPKIVEKLLKTYSTNEVLREQTISQLLSPGKTPSGHLKNTLNMDLDVNLKDNPAVSKEILEKYLNTLGYSIFDNTDDE
jgi:DNA-directed RNA polymerase beta subunit